jgi:hypothetical protein
MHMVKLPPGAEDHLRRDHPRLLELRARYDRYAKEFQSPSWSKSAMEQQSDLLTFRDDSPHTLQIRSGVNPGQSLLTAYYAREIDSLNIFSGLSENEYFGVYGFDFNGKLISRDLVDSVIQINFLHRHMNLGGRPNATVLDIGAGYGRLPLRLSQALPNLKNIWCTGGVAESTFICEYYLTLCGVDPRVEVFALDEVAGKIRGAHIDVVTNVQNFTECTLASIEFWLFILAAATVEYLLIVPDQPGELLSTELDGSRRDFLPLIEAHGFRLMAQEFAYHGAPSVQKYGLHGDTKYWLFQAG